MEEHLANERIISYHR